MEKNISDIVSSLYTQFILRDLFAKIIPGLIFLLSIIFFVNDYNSIIKIKFFISNISFLFALLLIAISWLIGISIQSFGEFIRIIKIYHVLDENDKRKFNIDDWVNLRSHFLKKASDNELKFIERMSVIKEASGIFSLSLLFSSIVFIPNYYINSDLSLFKLIIIIIINTIIIIFSLRMNYVVWRSEIKFMKRFIL